MKLTYGTVKTLETPQGVKVAVVPSYFIDQDRIDFLPISSAPPATHIVTLNGRRVGWLSNEFRPSAKTAVFFWNKHKEA